MVAPAQSRDWLDMAIAALSTTATRRTPASRAVIAAQRPAKPLPTIRRSVSIGSMLMKLIPSSTRTREPWVRSDFSHWLR